MKKIMLFIAFACCLALQAKAQTSTEREYIPLLNSENQWNQVLESVFGVFKATYLTKLGNDTLINDTNYYQLLTTRDSLVSIWLDDGYIREDTQNRKVFYKRDKNMEVLLYDFGAKVGDTIQTYDFYYGKGNAIIVVQNTSEILLGGKLRKKMNVHSMPLYDSDNADYYNHTWIEGIGDIDGLLQSTLAFYPMNSMPEYLLCFFEKDELIYKSEKTNIADCFVWHGWDDDVAIDQFRERSDILIYPNPVDNYLVLTSLSKIISLVEIFNISGHKIYSQAHGNTIDVSSFSKGMYLLKVYDSSGQVSSFKIIKK